MTDSANDFKYQFVLNGKTIKYRKWKVKDKFTLDKANTNYEIHKAVVYDCLEEQVPLDAQELLYAIYQIRKISVKRPVKYTFECTHCSHKFEYIAELDKIFEPRFSQYKPFKINDNEYEFAEIRNAKFYEDTLEKIEDLEAKLIVDMALHIKSINRNDAMKLNDVMAYINNMDLDEYTELQKTFLDQRFMISFMHEVECPICHHKQKYVFDTFPNFYPLGWESKLS